MGKEKENVVMTITNLRRDCYQHEAATLFFPFDSVLSVCVANIFYLLYFLFNNESLDISCRRFSITVAAQSLCAKHNVSLKNTKAQQRHKDEQIKKGNFHFKRLFKLIFIAPIIPGSELLSFQLDIKTIWLKDNTLPKERKQATNKQVGKFQYELIIN